MDILENEPSDINKQKKLKSLNELVGVAKESSLVDLDNKKILKAKASIVGCNKEIKKIKKLKKLKSHQDIEFLELDIDDGV